MHTQIVKHQPLGGPAIEVTMVTEPALRLAGPWRCYAGQGPAIRDLGAIFRVGYGGLAYRLAADDALATRGDQSVPAFRGNHHSCPTPDAAALRLYRDCLERGLLRGTFYDVDADAEVTAEASS